MVLGVVGSIILSVTDSGGGFGGDGSCGGGSSSGCRYVLLTHLYVVVVAAVVAVDMFCLHICIYLCAHCVLMTDIAVCKTYFHL